MRRQAGVSDENEEGGCEYETVQPGTGWNVDTTCCVVFQQLVESSLV